ncbi:hypothetical protein Tsubulata_020241 [Turnera subulata]|uniref:Cystatin domain-containing protein n=1 Tax=Turnera subulata TaxID=218843 RepID=A0A9Q0JGC7_9ROSI|nr:hypothetical protein Tsubulata_020241 [Turnera subulata]
MADSRLFSSSPEKKKTKLDHEPGFHHAAAHSGAISSSASKQEAESVAGDAVSGPEADDDPMMTQEEEEYGDGPEEKAHHDESTLADDDDIESDSQAGDNESDADEKAHHDESTTLCEHREVGVRCSIKNDEHMAIYDECVRQSEKSGGFDIDVDLNLTDKLPKWLHGNMCRPIRVDDESLAPILKEMGILACEFANSNQSEPQKLEFLRVVKANYNGILISFYITFAAVDKLDQSDGPDGKEKLYQAVVFFVNLKQNKNYKSVVMVRRKPTVAADDGLLAKPKRSCCVAPSL